MKLSEVVYFPYSKAHSHFKQAAHSEWRGRTIHYIVGTLEYIPLLNYLIVLVDLAVQSFFKPRPVAPKSFDPPKPPQSLDFNQFLLVHQIELPKTPLSHTILEIESQIEGWDESKPAGDVYWGSRIRILGQQIEKLNGKIEAEKLQSFRDSFRVNTAQVFKDFKQFLGELKQVEEGKSKAILSALQPQFAALTFPQIATFDELMAAMQFADKVRLNRYECSFAKLKEFGLTTVEDFNSIGFFDFESDYQTAVYFEVVARHLPTAQAAYQQFLKSFAQKVNQWKYRAQAQSSDETFKSAQDIQRFIQAARPRLLESYLRQNNLNGFWGTFPPQERSLNAYLIECNPKPSPFGLGFQIEEN